MDNICGHVIYCCLLFPPCFRPLNIANDSRSRRAKCVKLFINISQWNSNHLMQTYGSVSLSLDSFCLLKWRCDYVSAACNDCFAPQKLCIHTKWLRYRLHSLDQFRHALEKIEYFYIKTRLSCVPNVQSQFCIIRMFSVFCRVICIYCT
jgi:hypothetical protein